MKAQVRIRAQGLCEYCHAAEQWQYVEFTVEALQFNRERVLNVRAADVEVGRHPPEGDSVLEE